MHGNTPRAWQIVLEVQSRSRAAVPFDVEGLQVSGWYGDRQLREMSYQPTFSGRHSLPYRIPAWEREVWTAPASQLHDHIGGLDVDYVKLRVRIGRRHRRVRVQPKGQAQPGADAIPLK